MLITSHPSAPDGSVLRPTSYRPSDFVAPCAILCRNTAPLVSFAYALLQRDVPCRVLGREIGAALVSIVRKCRAQNLSDLGEKLDAWRERELQRCDRQNVSPERIFDQHSCLVFFISALDSDSQTVDDLVAKIDLLFSDTNSAGVVLSTVHKSKGLEWPLVFILDFQKYMPSKYATLPWQRLQERNLIYVAITRCADKLCYISSECWEKEENK